jgi:hypothetical protein
LHPRKVTPAGRGVLRISGSGNKTQTDRLQQQTSGEIWYESVHLQTHAGKPEEWDVGRIAENFLVDSLCCTQGDIGCRCVDDGWHSAQTCWQFPGRAARDFRCILEDPEVGQLLYSRWSTAQSQNSFLRYTQACMHGVAMASHRRVPQPLRGTWPGAGNRRYTGFGVRPLIVPCSSANTAKGRYHRARPARLHLFTTFVSSRFSASTIASDNKVFCDAMYHRSIVQCSSPTAARAALPMPESMMPAGSTRFCERAQPHTGIQDDARNASTGMASWKKPKKVLRAAAGWLQVLGIPRAHRDRIMATVLESTYVRAESLRPLVSRQVPGLHCTGGENIV